MRMTWPLIQDLAIDSFSFGNFSGAVLLQRALHRLIDRRAGHFVCVPAVGEGGPSEALFVEWGLASRGDSFTGGRGGDRAKTPCALGSVAALPSRSEKDGHTPLPGLSVVRIQVGRRW